MSEKKQRTLIKIIVLGTSNVGKTAIMTRFATGKFSDLRKPTIGADFMTKRLLLHDIETTLQIWDTAGQERFHQGSIGSSFYRGASGALLVYDVNNEKSFEQLSMWRDECLNHKGGREAYFPIVVIGNKIDIRDEMEQSLRVDQSPVIEWCRENSYGHIETSAKDGKGVEAAMMAIAGLSLEALNSPEGMAEREAIGREKKNTISDLNTAYVPKKNNDCCV